MMKIPTDFQVRMRRASFEELSDHYTPVLTPAAGDKKAPYGYVVEYNVEYRDFLSLTDFGKFLEENSSTAYPQNSGWNHIEFDEYAGPAGIGSEQTAQEPRPQQVDMFNPPVGKGNKGYF